MIWKLCFQSKFIIDDVFGSSLNCVKYVLLSDYHFMTSCIPWIKIDTSIFVMVMK